MQTNGVALDPPELDLRCFDENRSKFPAEQLLVYAGQHVAWTPNGTRILACGLTRKDLDEKLASLGIQFSQVVHDYIDPPLE
jgi:hypothetical protein